MKEDNNEWIFWFLITIIGLQIMILESKSTLINITTLISFIIGAYLFIKKIIKKMWNNEKMVNNKMKTKKLVMGLSKTYNPKKTDIHPNYVNPIDINCPYKPRGIIISILLTISFYKYMQSQYNTMNKKNKLECHKDKGNPTIPNAYHMARSGWI